MVALRALLPEQVQNLLMATTISELRDKIKDTSKLIKKYNVRQEKSGDQIMKVWDDKNKKGKNIMTEVEITDDEKAFVKKIIDNPKEYGKNLMTQQFAVDLYKKFS